MRPKYLCTNGMGPIRVESWLEKGYRIIGKYKLRNPHPRLLTKTDWKFIFSQFIMLKKKNGYISIILSTKKQIK